MRLPGPPAASTVLEMKATHRLTRTLPMARCIIGCRGPGELEERGISCSSTQAGPSGSGFHLWPAEAHAVIAIAPGCVPYGEGQSKTPSKPTAKAPILGVWMVHGSQRVVVLPGDTTPQPCSSR